MSHLRPTYPDSRQPKKYCDYTAEERLSALTQLQDEVVHRLRQVPARPITADLADLIIQMAAGTEKAHSLEPEILRAASDEAKKLLLPVVEAKTADKPTAAAVVRTKLQTDAFKAIAETAP